MRYPWYVPKFIRLIHAIFQELHPSPDDKSTLEIIGQDVMLLQQTLSRIEADRAILLELRDANTAKDKLLAMGYIINMQQTLIQTYVPVHEVQKLNELVGKLVDKYLPELQVDEFYRAFPQFVPATTNLVEESMAQTLGDLVRANLESGV